MFKIIHFYGGLGNQMFQYAFYLSLHCKYKLSIYLFDIQGSLSCHNGFELPFIFKNCHRGNSWLYKFTSNKIPFILANHLLYEQADALQYFPEVYDFIGFSVSYKGFWQTERYFQNIEKRVRKAFVFNEGLLNTKNHELSKQMQAVNSVSLHVRRGDYLYESFRQTCDIEYYQRAINYINSHVKEPVYYVFSDDIEWCKSNLPAINTTFIDWNNGSSNWQDMFLMSQCKHNIVANSSFSWWGAWLNAFVNKIVIAPQVWFVGNYNEDIVPKEWIRL